MGSGESTSYSTKNESTILSLTLEKQMFEAGVARWTSEAKEATNTCADLDKKLQDGVHMSGESNTVQGDIDKHTEVIRQLKLKYSEALRAILSASMPVDDIDHRPLQGRISLNDPSLLPPIFPYNFADRYTGLSSASDQHISRIQLLRWCYKFAKPFKFVNELHQIVWLKLNLLKDIRIRTQDGTVVLAFDLLNQQTKSDD
ncbi:hypothetical protein VTO58DRAFT_110264 [Aureobasidium pullulans]